MKTRWITCTEKDCRELVLTYPGEPRRCPDHESAWRQRWLAESRQRGVARD